MNRNTIHENIVVNQHFSNREYFVVSEGFDEFMGDLIKCRKLDLKDYVKELVYLKSKRTNYGFFLDFDELKEEDKINVVEGIIIENNYDYSDMYTHQFLENPESAKDLITSILLDYQPEAQKLIDDMCSDVFDSYVRENHGSFYYDYETGERCAKF